jgi:hypothetical protein
MHSSYFSILLTRNNAGKIPSYEMNKFSGSSLLENICHIRAVLYLIKMRETLLFKVISTIFSTYDSTALEDIADITVS